MTAVLNDISTEEFSRYFHWLYRYADVDVYREKEIALNIGN